LSSTETNEQENNKPYYKYQGYYNPWDFADEVVESIGFDIFDQLDWDAAVDKNGIGESFALDVNSIAETVDFDLEVVFMEGDGVVEGADAEDGVGLNLGDGNGIVDKKGIGGS